MVFSLPHIRVFSVKINTLSIIEFIDLISILIRNKKNYVQQTSVNAYTILCCQTDKALRESINKSDLVNIDGMSVVWALKFLGYKNVVKASSPDIFNSLIGLAAEKGYRPYFLGSTKEVLELAMYNLKKKYPTLQIAGYHHGYFNEDESDEIAKQIRESKADMLFLGISSPKKELFVEKYKDIMKVPYTLGVGGVFDIIAGKTKRAPLWMQNSGLEWLYRFIQEPQRMWRRYLIGNIQFIWIAIKEKLKK